MTAPTGLDRPTPRRGLGTALLWACFLGCSWTWVIGMCFPALLLRDYGVAGWVLFAVPNVLGAAAMGFILPRPDISERLVTRHGPAMRWFSGVTIAFQMYVALWLGGWLWLALLVVLPWLVLGRTQRRALGAWLAWLAVGAAIISWCAFAWATRLEGAWLDVFSDTRPARLSPRDLWLFLPSCVAGFVLCPYLDATFHRARRSMTPKTGMAGFALGFGVVFASMIVFSLCYAAIFLPWMEGRPAPGLMQTWRVLLMIHLGVQIAFTLMAHSRERFEHRDRDDRRPIVWFSLVLAAALVGAILSRTSAAPLDNGLSLGEVGYRGFLLFYGIAFPAYVWLCMIPTFRKTRPMHRGAVFIVVTLLCMPLGFAAFILDRTDWLVGVWVIFVLGRAVVELLPGSASRTRAASPRPLNSGAAGAVQSTDGL